MDRTAYPQYLRRSQASRYLAEIWGLNYTPGTLAKMCSQGRGPETHRAGRDALHTPEALDAFARSRITAGTAKVADAAALSTALPPIVPSAGEWMATA